jgi:phenylacetate-CoA ligase
MNIHLLKHIRDNIPEGLKYLTAPLFRNKLIKNKEFLKYYDLIEKREKISSEKIKEYQFNQLKKILIYSYQNVPYYQELFKKVSFNPFKFSDFEQIENIPFLTREIITDNFEKLRSKWRIGRDYYVGFTGGSTGLPLKFLLDMGSIFKENAFIYSYRKRLGYNLDDKLVTFRYGVSGDRLWKFSPMYNSLIFSPMKLSKDTITEYAKKINEYKPQYLNGYLSAIWFFAKLLEEYHLKLSFKLKGIFLISENLDIKQRKFIEEFFNVASMTFYGHSERCIIAEEIIPGRYVFDPYYGYTELIHSGENNLSIVGTGFLNYIMPFIRYKTDDICTSYGQYYSIEGKRSSTLGLYGINNEFFASTTFELFDPVFKNIINYQYIQKVKGKADLMIIVNKNFSKSEIDSVRKKINYLTKGIIEINVKIVDKLILSPLEKYQTIISYVDDN